MRFVIESNLVTEKLKLFNEILKKTNLKTICKKIVTFEPFISNEIPLNKLVNVHILFYDVIEDLSSCYGFKVCIFLKKLYLETLINFF